MGPLAQIGLALATAIGAWINMALVIWLGLRAGFLTFAPGLLRSLAHLVVIGVMLAALLWGAERVVGRLLSGVRLREELTLLSVMMLGAVVYAVALLVLYRGQWRSLIPGMRRGG
jgi:putative peptidoglycan lipid II flippase